MPLSMDRWVGKVAIVTGASSGLGAAIAVRLTQEGLKVVGLARRKDRLEALAESVSQAKGKFYPFQADVTKEEEIVRAFAWVKQNLGAAHILVNNAGIYREVSFSKFSAVDTKAILDLNVLALTIAASEAVKMFKEFKINGHIINMNSIAGQSVVDMTGLGIYTASKHAVTALTEVLRLELQQEKSGTKVTSISPGLAKSEIRGEGGNEMKNLPSILGDNILEAEDIADAVVYILSTPPNCQIDELKIRPIYTGV